MLISLNWLRDFVELPSDFDPLELGERFTRTTAELEGIEPIKVGAKGLIAARVLAVDELPGARSLRLVKLDIGGGKTVESITTAPAVHVGLGVVFAPPGAAVCSLGEIGETEVAGRKSYGMILPGEAIGIPMAAHEAIFLPEHIESGAALPSGGFDDWVLEIDNKSLTHRPDLWGHYGIAREVAAILRVPLAPYPMVDLAELNDAMLPEIPIKIADPDACRRYSGLMLEGVPAQPAPLWMQLRLGHVGLRPISGLVDLTNYVMADLGQPMHAFDGSKVDRIEVNFAGADERFKTLDGVERVLSPETLVIQSGGESVALAGIMGGLATEVFDTTCSLLLESANFNPITVRRAAGQLGLRTDASARFEKSLDPLHTVMAIQRFVHIARGEYPNMKLISRLSDAFPKPFDPVSVDVKPANITRAIGRALTTEDVQQILTPLGFVVEEKKDALHVRVPSYRATNDVSIEVDVIEELARTIGYDHIEASMPLVSVRHFEMNRLHELERRTLEYLTTTQRFHEIHGYIWYDANWLAQLGVDPGPCVELANPAADGLHRLRRSLMPGLLAATTKNRFHFSAFSIVELGQVFEPASPEDAEFTHVGMVCARRGKQGDGQLYDQIKGAIEGWSRQVFSRQPVYAPVEAVTDRPWEHPTRMAEIHIGGLSVGRVGVIDVALRRTMDEHLAAWSIAWAELRLDQLADLDPIVEKLGSIPNHPVVEMDFSLLVTKATPYHQVAQKLAAFTHPLLRQVRFVSQYEGDAVGADHRSLTFGLIIGDETRTLVEHDAADFRKAFETHVRGSGYEIRG